MSDERIIGLDLIQSWFWRCLEDGLLVRGSELCVQNPGSGHIVPLAKGKQDRLCSSYKACRRSMRKHVPAERVVRDRMDKTENDASKVEALSTLVANCVP